ncbi:hypothetical protein MRX96_051579 [Rhipicephalus microplus]
MCREVLLIFLIPTSLSYQHERISIDRSPEEDGESNLRAARATQDENAFSRLLPFLGNIGVIPKCGSVCGFATSLGCAPFLGYDYGPVIRVRVSPWCLPEGWLGLHADRQCRARIPRIASSPPFTSRCARAFCVAANRGNLMKAPAG